MTAGLVDILVAEDNLSDAELMTTSLATRSPPRRVHVVHDGEEALDFVFARGAYDDRASEAPPRVILLDVSLPKINGLDVLRTLKTDPRTAPIPVVMLTSSNVERDVLRGYRYGANSYVQKPIEFTRFRDVVRQIADYWMTVNEPAPARTFAPKET